MMWKWINPFMWLKALEHSIEELLFTDVEDEVKKLVRRTS